MNKLDEIILEHKGQKYTRGECVLLYVLAGWEGLHEMGITNAPPWMVMPKSQQLVHKIKESGFEPTEAECHWAMDIFTDKSILARIHNN